MSELTYNMLERHQRHMCQQLTELENKLLREQVHYLGKALRRADRTLRNNRDNPQEVFSTLVEIEGAFIEAGRRGFLG